MCVSERERNAQAESLWGVCVCVCVCVCCFVLLVHVNIGNVLDDMGNPECALVELKKGLDVLVSVYGHEHRTWRTPSII